jgi:Glycolipid transfer protein (GLTP)
MLSQEPQLEHAYQAKDSASGMIRPLWDDHSNRKLGDAMKRELPRDGLYSLAREEDFRYRAALPVVMVMVATTAPNPLFLNAVNRLLSLDLSLSGLHVCVIAIASGILLFTASSGKNRNNKGGNTHEEQALRPVPSVQFMVEEPMSLSRRISHGALSKVSSAAQLAKVSSTASFARISEAVMHSSISVGKMCFQGLSPKEGSGNVATISAAECFVSVDSIAEMTLEDITTVIRYAIQSNRADFDEVTFYSSLNPYMQRIISDFDEACMESRGMHALPAKLSGPTKSGDVDTLMFLAAMRIFVEWRIVRQVPEGYKAYAVGISLAKRDFMQNASKMEAAAHAWIQAQRKVIGTEGEVHSPTLRQLLEFELSNHVHTRLPRLKDNTAALSLLWAKRQIQYQTMIYENLLHVPHKMDAVEAVRTAYKEVFDSYHGWLIQKTFNYSFSGTPPVEEIYKMMNPRHFHQVMETVNNPIMNESPVMIKSWSLSGGDTVETSISMQSSFEENGDDHNQNCGAQEYEIDQMMSKDEGFDILHLGRHIEMKWEKFTKNVQNGWEDFVSNLDPNKKGKNWQGPVRVSSPGACTTPHVCPSNVPALETGGNASSALKAPRRIISVPAFVLDSGALETYIDKEMTKAAHNHIDVYLETMQPLLKDLSLIFFEFNMNDPTRV